MPDEDYINGWMDGGREGGNERLAIISEVVMMDCFLSCS